MPLLPFNPYLILPRSPPPLSPGQLSETDWRQVTGSRSDVSCDCTCTSFSCSSCACSSYSQSNQPLLHPAAIFGIVAGVMLVLVATAWICWFRLVKRALTNKEYGLLPSLRMAAAAASGQGGNRDNNNNNNNGGGGYGNEDGYGHGYNSGEYSGYPPQVPSKMNENYAGGGTGIRGGFTSRMAMGMATTTTAAATRVGAG